MQSTDNSSGPRAPQSGALDLRAKNEVKKAGRSLLAGFARSPGRGLPSVGLAPLATGVPVRGDAPNWGSSELALTVNRARVARADARQHDSTALCTTPVERKWK
jgi:hypothetical protein